MKPIWLIGVALATIMVGPGPELVGVWAEDSDGTVLIARSPEAEKSQAKDAESPAAKSDEGAKPPPKPVEAEPKKPVTSLILTVKLALMADPRLFPYDIEVDEKGQEVILSGKVPTDKEKAAATEVAQGLEGVKSVGNKLEVSKDLRAVLDRKQDDLLTHYVKERFAKSKTLESAKFDVSTENGVVALSGKARFQVIVLEAAEAARQVPGVKAVKTDAVRLEATE